MAESPFQKGWWGIELPDARDCNGTYCFYEYEGLPPLDESLFRGEFQWLTELRDVKESMLAYRGQKTHRYMMKHNLGLLRQSASQANMILPADFIHFIENPDWHESIPSCTACTLDLSESLIPSLVEDGAYTVRFLRDQQDVLIWYLYLAPNGEISVICSPIHFDRPNINEPASVVKAHTMTAAPSFEAFMYRFWIENSIWFAREEGNGALTAAQQAYVDHYL